MPKSPQDARTRTHARPFEGYRVSYSPSRWEYKIVVFRPGELIKSIRFWWGLKRNPAVKNVKWGVLL